MMHEFAATAQTDDAPTIPPMQRRFAIAAVLAAMVLAVLDAAITNVALPTIARLLHVAPGTSVWIITAYQTGLVIGLLPCAAFGESLGNRRVFSAGVALFTAASALCALSPSLPWLIAARLLQGLGAAAIMALGIALLRQVVPGHQLGAAIAWNALAVALATAAGPAIGAVILASLSWPWLFALNLPLGGMVLLASLALPGSVGTARRVDRLSVALNALSFALFVVGAEVLVDKPALAGALIATAAVALALLVRRELPDKSRGSDTANKSRNSDKADKSRGSDKVVLPLIPLDLLDLAAFRVSIIASVFCFTGTTMGLLALPFYLQHSLAQNALMTALYMTPWPLTVAIAAPIAGRLVNHVSTASLCAAGGICLATGLTAAALWPLHDNLAPLFAITVLCGVGFGLFQVPNNRNLFALANKSTGKWFLSAPPDRTGAAGGMQATARLAGQTAGGVGMSLLFNLASIDLAPRIALGIGAILTLVAGLVSTLRLNQLNEAGNETCLPCRLPARLNVKQSNQTHAKV